MHPACGAFPLMFNAIIARISGFLILFPFPKMSASTELDQLFFGQTWNNFPRCRSSSNTSSTTRQFRMPVIR
jgi:hypothetical protein